MQIGFLTALTITFIVLKLCEVITWSWWLILLPFYGSIILVAFLATIVAILAKVP